jgi:predicted nuclease of predicted toxin-antitoxin system
VRFLLDQNVPPEITLLFVALDHEADHTSAIGLGRALDPEVAQSARAYDALLTLDNFRQEADWIAVHRAIVEQGVNVLRLRLPKNVPAELLNLTIVRQITYKMEEWTKAFSEGAALITVSREDKELRIRDREYVKQMLDQRYPG